MKQGTASWLVWAAPLAVLPFLGKAPAIDEETYLWLGAHLDALRPYDWTRVWPPYDADGYVFAHPPLHLWWMKLWSFVAGLLPAMRALAGLPWIALLGLSVGRLADRTTHHPALAGGAWLASTVVALGLQDTLMIDLPATALVTAAVAAYREGLEDDERWMWGAGLALGLAAVTKYSTLVVWPVIAWHMARRDRWRWEVVGPALGIPLMVEGWLFAAYGRPHVWEVLTRRAEIAAGPWSGRVLGTISRMALLPLSALLLYTNPRSAAAGVAGAILLLGIARPTGVSLSEASFLLVCAALGGMGVARAVHAVAQSPLRRRKGDRGDPLLLGGWVLAGVIGVIVLHNYAAARYLFPVAAPLAILITRSAEERRGGKAALMVSIGLSAAVALAVSLADYRFAAAGVEVGRKVATEAQGGRFAGEWGFRYALEEAGWRRWQPGEALPAGTVVAVADNSSPGAVPTEGWEPVGRVESDDQLPLRVVDIDRRVGLYAETLGVLPLGFGRGPIEGATLWRVK